MNTVQLKVLVILMWNIFHEAVSDDCSRKQSKIVRSVVKEVLPLYTDHGVSIPATCPLAPHRDIYGLQEDNKYEENSAKWVCKFCGKSFYEEGFLDLHFMNRHPNSLRQDATAVCLANWCDVFRCDVLSQRVDHGAMYWEQALCREDALRDTQHKCAEMIQTCIPDQADALFQNIIQDHLNQTICHYLTCDQYWDIKHNQLSVISLTLYIMGSLILVFGACVYYIVLRAQLSQNPPQLLRRDSDISEDDSCVSYPSSTKTLRYRHSVS